MKASEVFRQLQERISECFFKPAYPSGSSEVLGNNRKEVYNRHIPNSKEHLIERLCIPDRIFSFRVTWMDDKGQIQTNMDTVSSITMRSARTKVVSVFTLL